MKFDLKNKDDIDKLLINYSILVFKLRNSRIKAKRAAIMEVYSVLKDFDVQFLPNSPLGDIKGIFSFAIYNIHLRNIEKPLSRLGYSKKVYILDFSNLNMENKTDLKSINPLYWKNKRFSIYNFYEVDDKLLEESQVHNRSFSILDSKLKVKEIIGYRGNGTEIGRRALPVEDSRFMINISMPNEKDTILDPFAGAGGIIYEAKNYHKNLTVISSDIDKVISPGLEKISDVHYISDVKLLDLEDKKIDRIITEVPFSNNANKDILVGIEKLVENLTEFGRLVVMCKSTQNEMLNKKLIELGMIKYFESNINRKGTDVVIIAYSKINCDEDIKFFKSLDTIC